MDYMKLAQQMSEKSHCLSRKVGAVLVSNDTYYATYNQVKGCLSSCGKEGQCLRRKLGIPSGERLELCRIVHAETAAIIESLWQGINTVGSVLYVTDTPCNICAHIIVTVGIKKVIYKGDYPGNGLDVLRQGGVEVEQYRGTDPVIIENPDEGMPE